MKTFLELATERCKPLTPDTKPLTEGEVKAYSREVPDWQVKDNALTKTSSFTDFVAAMDYVNKVAKVAQEENHHPDICISYNKVGQTLTSHKVGGLTENDFIMAAKIDRIES